MATQSDSQVYQGEEKIIVAIDLGTTHTAVSFAHAYPGSVVDVRMVTRWKGQPEAAGDSKIPTIVAYEQGKLVACGAEAREYLGDETYEVSKWFKLHLHPDSMNFSDEPPAYDSDTGASPAMEIPPLPSNVTLAEVYTDFMRYVFGGFRTFFQKTTPNGLAIWDRLSSNIVVVLTIPNGWDTRQQEFLKEAAQEAGIVQSEEDADLRIEFVTEGEASVHYILGKINHKTWLKKGTMFAVTDAGGSTVDSTLYVCKALEPKLELEEVCTSECVQAGGVFVDRAARSLFTAKLSNSKFGDEETISDMVEKFEQRAKRIFDGSQESNVIEFGSRRDNDREYGIIQGKIALTASEVCTTFDDVIKRSTDSCLKLLRGRKVKHLLLVGGFGESPYLRWRFEEEFGSNGTDVVTVEEPSKKAASEGAVTWYTKQIVSARVARFTIGIKVNIPFNPARAEHLKRRSQVCVHPNGDTYLQHAFDTIVKKGQLIPQNFSKLARYIRFYSEKPESLDEFWEELLVWKGEGTTEWTTDADGETLPPIRTLCSIEADLTPSLAGFKQVTSKHGIKYWRGDLAVRCIYNGTKLQARFEWEVEGKTYQGPIRVIPASILK
ncbi:hypothetical protein FRC14_003961 [Serendipita sp. 396]|nr:hypothetical protein FRC14_003961 [Serendipita sp. 396]KAG8830435.1 hypothetical protein FRC18_008096 [Serendipita sp. 400]